MAKKLKEEAETLNFEDSTLDELGRVPVCGNFETEPSDVLESVLEGPHFSRRCHSSKRELLKHLFQFNAE